MPREYDPPTVEQFREFMEAIPFMDSLNLSIMLSQRNFDYYTSTQARMESYLEVARKWRR